MSEPMTDAQLRAHLNTLDQDGIAEALRIIQLEDDKARAWLERPDALHLTARWYAQQLKWPVFPLRPGAKTPATTSGFKDATIDLDQIDSWWRRQPALNIGLPTGLAFDVLDIDAPDGFNSLADWREELPGLRLGDFAVAYTGNDGRHYYLPPTGQGNAAGLRPGIDYRGQGGYVVAPPSKLENGRRYSWITPPKVSP